MALRSSSKSRGARLGVSDTDIGLTEPQLRPPSRGGLVPRGRNHMDSIGVGLIGTGYMGKCHALAWNAVHAVFGDGPGVRLEHLCETTPEFAAQRAAEFGFSRSGADWRP